MDEILNDIQSSMIALGTLLIEKGIFTIDELKARKSMAVAEIDQHRAQKREELLEKHPELRVLFDLFSNPGGPG